MPKTQGGKPKIPTVHYDGVLYEWNGKSWGRASLKVWDGFDFIKRPLLYFGGYWKNIDSSGDTL